jgi:hypothetical protein
MKRGRFVKLAALAGTLVLATGAMRSAHAAGLPAKPERMQAFPGPGAVLVSYSTVLNAAGYNVYRRGAAETADKAVKVNAQPTAYTWLVDDNQGQGLAIGTPLLYFVKAVQADGAESAASTEVVVTPQVPILGGLYAHDIGTTFPSTVKLEGDVLTITASGHELWSADDGGTFVGAAVAGDYSVTAKLLERQTGGHEGAAKVGVMIREGLIPGDRYAINAAFRGRGVKFERRTTFKAIGGTAVAEDGTVHDDMQYPIWLRLTKEGGIVTAYESFDGTDFTQVGTEADFGALSDITYAGLGLSAVHINTEERRYVTAKFDATSIKIE